MLDLNKLIGELPTITEKMGGLLAESAAFCLEYNRHLTGSEIRVVGSKPKSMKIVWSFEIDHRAQYTYQDKPEVTELGATGVAILLSLELTGYNSVIRSCKGTGFDYWIGNFEDSKELPFQKKARLEVSGILNDSESVFKSRVKQKLKQTDVSDFMKIPAYVSVVEFSEPVASLVKK